MKQSITVIKPRESSLPLSTYTSASAIYDMSGVPQPASTYIPASGAPQQPLRLKHPRQPQADEEEACESEQICDEGDEEDEYREEDEYSNFEQSMSDALSASRASSAHSASLNSQISAYDSEPL
jgi:hypothetical protein